MALTNCYLANGICPSGIFPNDTGTIASMHNDLKLKIVAKLLYLSLYMYILA
jgi:hypothetical protein